MSNLETIDLGLRQSLKERAEERSDHTLTTTINRIRTGRHVGRQDVGAEPEGVITRPDQFDSSYHGSTEIICKDIADHLVKRFRGWAWAIQPNEFGRIINIFNLHLSSEFGYTIRMVDIMNDPRRREAIRAGHEILRRFRMPDHFDPDAVMEMPRDLKGQGIPDISDFKNRKQARDAEIAHKLATGEWQIVEVDGMRYLRAKK